MPSKKASRKKEKQRSRVQRGQSRLEPKSCTVAALLEDWEEAKKSGQEAQTNQKSKAMKHHAGLNAFLEDNALKSDWKKQMDALLAHHNAANYNKDEYKKVVELATGLLQDIHDAYSKHGVNVARTREEAKDPNTPLIVHYGEVCSYRLRSYARLELGYLEERSSDTRRQLLEGAVGDATEGLAMAQLGLTSSDEFVEGRPPSKEEIAMLITRGMSLRLLGDYEGAHTDLLAGIAAFDIKTQEWKGWPTRHEAIEQVLIVKALLKANSSRPHYKEWDDVVKLQKKFGLRMYAEECYKCKACGKKPSDTSTLSLCSRCKQVWACDKDCHKKAWKSGHKQECKEGKDIFIHVLYDDEKPAFDDRFDEQGYVLLKNPFCVVARDSKTGRYFDSLTNEDLFFLPSETEYMMSAAVESGAKTLNYHVGVANNPLPPGRAYRAL